MLSSVSEKGAGGEDGGNDESSSRSTRDGPGGDDPGGGVTERRRFAPRGVYTTSAAFQLSLLCYSPPSLSFRNASTRVVNRGRKRHYLRDASRSLAAGFQIATTASHRRSIESRDLGHALTED